MHIPRASRDRWLRLVALTLAVAAITFMVANLLWVWRFTVDDSYITLRYSRHLANGIGPTFNTSGPPAEGYTSFTWMLVLTIPHLLDIPPLEVAKALGVLATLGTTAVIASWARQTSHDTRVAAVAVAAAVAAYATLGRTAVHAVSGMETAFYTFLLTSLFYAAVRTFRSPARVRYWQLAILSALVGLSRPEGNLAAIVLMLGAAIALPVRERAPFAQAVAFGWAVPLVVYQVARLSYYGLFFPLPFYVKVSAPSLFPGATPVIEWLGDAAIRIGLPVGVAAATSSRVLWPVLAAVFAIVAFMLLPEHLNGYDFRYLTPLDPVLSVFFGLGIAWVLFPASRNFTGSDLDRPFSIPDLESARYWSTSRWRIGGVVALITLACGLAAADAPRSIRARLGYADGMASAHEPLGRDLAALGSVGRIALSDAGAIPYLSKWWTLDLVGLNTPEIALTKDRSPGRVLAADPHLIVLVSGSGERFEPVDWNEWEGPLYKGALEQGYTCVTIRRFDAEYWLWVLARPESAEARAVRNSVFSVPCVSPPVDGARNPGRARGAIG